MSDNAEEGIARTQAAAAQAHGADGLQKYHKKNIASVSERNLVFILIIAFVGLIAVWLTTKSSLVFYGSLMGAILLTILWGVLQIKKMHRVRIEREHQAKPWESEENNHQSHRE